MHTSHHSHHHSAAVTKNDTEKDNAHARDGELGAGSGRDGRYDRSACAQPPLPYRPRRVARGGAGATLAPLPTMTWTWGAELAGTPLWFVGAFLVMVQVTAIPPSGAKWPFKVFSSTTVSSFTVLPKEFPLKVLLSSPLRVYVPV